MTRQQIGTMAVLVALAAPLAGCGGGSAGGGVVTTPAPPPAPPPPPPPAPSTPPPPPSGPIGLTGDGNFVTYGLGYRFTSTPEGTQVQGPPAADPAARVEFRYLPGENVYEVLLPGFNRGRLQTLSYNGSYHQGVWQSVSGTYNAVTDGSTAARQDVFVTLSWPANNTPLQLSYTAFGYWQSRTADPAAPGRRRNDDGMFVYGFPTPASEIPRTGTASYTALVSGSTAVTGSRVADGIGGTASLLFDFAAGSLSGSMQPVLYDWGEYGLGTYEFRQTVYASGQTTFSGKFAVPGSTGDSFFEGQFAGPQAAELMARWQAPYLHPITKEWGTMFGVWAGKRK